MELPEKVFDSIFICRFDYSVKHLIHVQTDSSDYCNIFPHLSTFLNDHWQRLIFRLPDFRSLFPQVSGGFIDIDNFLIFPN